jgi:hypothetical protein
MNIFELHLCQFGKIGAIYTFFFYTRPFDSPAICFNAASVSTGEHTRQFNLKMFNPLQFRKRLTG